MAGKIVEALMSKAPPPDELDSESDETAEPEGDDAEATAGAEFLDAIGVPEEKREAAMSALKDFVRACAKGDDY